MLTAYIAAAMRKARYEILEDGTYYGEIPQLDGVFSNASTLEECRDLLASILEGWILLGVSLGHDIPEIDGAKILVKKSA